MIGKNLLIMRNVKVLDLLIRFTLIMRNIQVKDLLMNLRNILRKNLLRLAYTVEDLMEIRL